MNTSVLLVSLSVPDCELVPSLSVTDPGRDVDDLGAVRVGVDELETTLVQLEGDVLLPRVAGVDTEDDALKVEAEENINPFKNRIPSFANFV